MSEEQETPAGPDLTEGVPAADLPEGGQLVGRVGAEEVLVARIGGALFAVGARCTHYHGPLGEGLIVGDTVRCPWHHAHFDLRTGAAVKAPALSPIACYDVTVAGGLVRVGGKKAPPAVPASPAGAPTSI